jgi:hypothetical protein
VSGFTACKSWKEIIDKSSCFTYPGSSTQDQYRVYRQVPILLFLGVAINSTFSPTSPVNLVLLVVVDIHMQSGSESCLKNHIFHAVATTGKSVCHHLPSSSARSHFFLQPTTRVQCFNGNVRSPHATRNSNPVSDIQVSFLAKFIPLY